MVNRTHLRRKLVFESRKTGRAFSPPVSPRRVSLSVEKLAAYAASWQKDCRSGRCSATYLNNIANITGKLLWWLRRYELHELDTNALRDFFIYLQDSHTLPEGRWGEEGQTRENGRTGRGVAASVRYRPVSSTTVADYRRVLSTFCYWMVDQQHIPASPMANVRATVDREGVHDFRVFSAEEVRRILDAAKQRSGLSIRHLRDYALCLLLLDTGLRASEVCALTWGTLNLEQRRATIAGKGDKRRTVYWTGDTNRALWAYLNALQPEEDLKSAVFVSENGANIGRGLTRYGLCSILGGIGERAGVDHVHVHAWRHTFAVLFLLAGGDSRTLQDLMGHTSPRMTARYIRFTGADLEEKANEFSPVAFVLRKRAK